MEFSIIFGYLPKILGYAFLLWLVYIAISGGMKLRIFALVILSTYFYNVIKYPSYTYRYKMTVEVETPTGIKSGSSVIEVHTDQWNDLLTGLCNGNSSATKIRGEGVMVDIAEGQTLFVLMQGEINVDLASHMLPYTFPMKQYDWSDDKAKEHAIEHIIYDSRSREGMAYYGKLKNVKGELPEAVWPLMVRFRDINDPVSIEWVDPKKLDSFFGNGVILKNIIIETTDDPLEWKIENRLTWFLKFNKLIGYITTLSTYGTSNNIIGIGQYGFSKR